MYVIDFASIHPPPQQTPCSIATILNIIAAQALYYITFNTFAWNGRRGSDGGSIILAI